MIDVEEDVSSEEDSASAKGGPASEEEDWLDEAPALERVKSYMVLSPADVKKQSKTLISEVKAILCLSSNAAAAALLRKFEYDVHFTLRFVFVLSRHFARWNKEKLISAYTDNPEKTLAAAGMGTLSLETAPKKLNEMVIRRECWR